MYGHVKLTVRFPPVLDLILCIIANALNACTVVPGEGFRRDGLPNVGGGDSKQPSGTAAGYILGLTTPHRHVIVQLILPLPGRKCGGKTKLLTTIPDFAATAISDKAADLSSQRMKNRSSLFESRP
jgi:hypothetical protein